VRRAVATFSVLLVTTVCCRVAPTREAVFWTWFQGNASELAKLEVADGPLADALAANLRAVDSGLVFELGGRAGEPRDFIISADGIADTFPAVERLAAAAPELAGWTVIAFRPRIGTGFLVRYDDFELKPDDLWFSTEPDGDRIGLHLYIAGLSEENRGVAIGASFIMLDSAIGEYDVVTKIGFIEHHPLPREPRLDGLSPFEALPAVVDGQSTPNGGAPSNNALKLTGRPGAARACAGAAPGLPAA